MVVILKEGNHCIKLMGHSLGVKVVVVVALIAVVVVAAASITLLVLHPQLGVHYVKLPSDYAFIVYEGNNQGTLYYVGPHGNLHNLGTYNLEMRQDFAQALNVPPQFNQNVVPQHSSYEPLDQVIVIYNPNGVVLPVAHNTILLNKLNPESYTDFVVPSDYLDKFMIAVGTGNYKAMIVSAEGANYLQYNDPQVWKLVLETKDLQSYSPQYANFFGGYIIETNNGTLIPYGFLSFTSPQTYGNNLPLKIVNTPYNGG